eukprot:CFRG5608T1
MVLLDTHSDLQEKNEKGIAASVSHDESADVLSIKSNDGDVWDQVFVDNGLKLKDMNNKQKAWTATYMFLKLVVVLGLLYAFIIALDLLGSGFQVLGGTQAGLVFRQSDLFDNPIAGLVIGILATVLVQSSSTSTSIIISMTASGLMTVDQAVYMIMGANIGTSVTNTIVSMGQIGDPNQFRRAFAGATVHDMFNFLSVAILLPLEYVSKFLHEVSQATVDSMGDIEGGEKINFLKTITKPLTNRIVRINKKLIEQIAREEDDEALDALMEESMVSWKYCDDDSSWFIYCPREGSWSDAAVGATLLIWALAMLMICLILLVKVLQSVFNGPLSGVLRKAINLSFPGRWDILSGYVLILVGAVLTILVQSSSITTSTLTPLVGLGALRLEKMFPVTLGANVGTTVTGMLAALSSPDVKEGLILAFCHVFFNLFGTLIWYPLPFMRAVPLSMARAMGNITAEHRWFALTYIIVAFLLIPLALLGLSMAGWQVMVGICVPIILVIIFFVMVFALRKHRPQSLPAWLSEFYWLPIWMRREPAFLTRWHTKMEQRVIKREEKKALESAVKVQKKSINAKILDRLADDREYSGTEQTSTSVNDLTKV